MIWPPLRQPNIPQNYSIKSDTYRVKKLLALS